MNNNDDKEYITIERCQYDSMKYKLYALEQLNSNKALIERLKSEEGMIIIDNGITNMVGFVTSDRLAKEFQECMDIKKKYEKVPKFVKWLINK